jgi:hypothetical protein
MDFLLYSTQQEADRARTKANLEHFALVKARSTIRILARDRKGLHRQRDERDQIIEELKANVAKLTKYIESLESHLGEEKALISARRIMPSLVMRMTSWRTLMIRSMMRMLDSLWMMRRKTPRSLMFRVGDSRVI